MRRPTSVPEMPSPGKMMTAWAHHTLWRFGIDIVRQAGTRDPVGLRMRLLQTLGVDLVLDVGANEGQYAQALRDRGYRGRIVSFEPLASPYAALDRRAHGDPCWEARRVAVAAESGRQTMHVAANGGASSSFLPMLPLHSIHAPEARFTSEEEVHVERLDTVAAAAVAGARSTFLKVDVQGFELEVLRGATGILKDLAAMQLELSLTPLYQDGPLFREVLDVVDDLGFELAGLEPAFADAQGRLLQVDGTFVRKIA